MWFNIKIVCFCSVILYCSQLCAAADVVSLNSNYSGVIERTESSQRTPGFYLHPIDRTTFQVNRQVWLQKFDIAPIFAYHPTVGGSINKVPVHVRIIQLSQTNHEKSEYIFIGKTLLNSTHDVRVNVTEILLNPDSIYEIQLEMPENMRLMYHDVLGIQEYKLSRVIGRTVKVEFFQHNLAIRPPFVCGSKRKLSQGMVKRIHLKYSRF